MATRSVVARWVGDEAWIGRYVHWDGYPANMVMTLLETILRKGFNEAVSTLIFENYGWSGLYPFVQNDDKENYVEGYGYLLKDSKSGDWITWESDNWGTEWCYVLDPSDKSVTILKYLYPDMSITNWQAEGKWFKHDVIDFGPSIARVNSGETTIEDEVSRNWQKLSVLEGVV